MAAASSAPPRNTFVWQTALGNGHVPNLDVKAVGVSRWLLQVVFPGAGGLNTRGIVEKVMGVHQKPEYRSWPQILLMVVYGPRSDKDHRAAVWDQLSFTTLVLMQTLNYEEFKEFSASDLQRLLDKYHKLASTASKLDVALSQKELIWASKTAASNIKTTKDMVNEHLHQSTGDGKYFFAGDAFLVDDSRFACVLDVASFPDASSSALCRRVWPLLLERNGCVEGSAGRRDIMVKVVDPSYHVSEPDRGLFLYHLFLIGSSPRAGLYESLSRGAFDEGAHFEIVSCVPSATTLEAALECALRNAKDGLKAEQMMAGLQVVDAHPLVTSENEVDKVIDDSLAEIKQAKMAD